MRWQKLFRRLFLYPMLLVAGCHTLLTGSPIPLWHIERFEAPLIVKSVGESHLELENGQKIALPFVKTLPQNNPLFQEAVSSGIEIGPTGEVFGLMWLDPNCGNDPYLWRKVRVNLSDLAGALYPAGIDDLRVHPDAIAFIQEHKRIDLSLPTRSHQNLHLSVWDGVRMRSIRQDYEAEVKTTGESTPLRLD